MKINDKSKLDHIPPAQRDPSIQPAKQPKSEESEATAESPRLSPLAKQIARAKQVADRLPEVRSEKVALARERLASGFYDTPEAQEELISRLASLVRESSL